MRSANNRSPSYQMQFLFLSVFIVEIGIVLSVREYQRTGRKLHNGYRTKHDVPKFQLDDELNSLAERCSSYYANIAKYLDHSCPNKKSEKFGTKIGENLYEHYGREKSSPAETLKIATQTWYDEIKYWDFAKGEPKPTHTLSEALHFTQMVWKNTTVIGVGYYYDRANLRDVVVTLYGPAGNTLQKFKENVPPPTNSTQPST